MARCAVCPSGAPVSPPTSFIAQGTPCTSLTSTCPAPPFHSLLLKFREYFLCNGLSHELLRYVPGGEAGTYRRKYEIQTERGSRYVPTKVRDTDREGKPVRTDESTRYVPREKAGTYPEQNVLHVPSRKAFYILKRDKIGN